MMPAPIAVTDSLSETERREADFLIGRLRGGNGRDASEALAIWASGNAQREAYVTGMMKAQALIDAAAPQLQLRYPRKPVRTRRLMRPSREASAALACTLVAVVAGMVWWLDPVLERQEVVTDFGEQRTVVLRDGTRIQLNSDSRLSTESSLRRRDAVLDRGEAQFEVAKDSMRPWRTQAGSASVEVRGTVFSVRREGDGASVILYEGSVALRSGPAAEFVLLQPGQGATARGGAMVQAPHAVNLAVAGAWREQRMVFEETPLSEALTEAQRYRRAPIAFDPTIAALRITGAFPTTDPERLLRLLPEALPVEVRRLPDGTAEVVPRAVNTEVLEPPRLSGR